MKSSLFAVSGLAALLVGLLLRLAAPALALYSWIIVALGVVVVIVSLLTDLNRVKGAFTSRRGKLGASTAVKISLFAGIVVLANVLSLGMHHRFDLTSSSKFTLSSKTQQVLESLKVPVQVVNFYSPSVPATISGYAQSLLSVYQRYTTDLSVSNVDPELNPDQARQYNIGSYGAQYGVTAFKGPNGERLVYGPQISAEAEYAFTSAILEVSGVKQLKVDFLVGQGEDNIYTKYNDARKALQENLFQVNELDLLKVTSVPKDVAVLIVAGPQKPLPARQAKILKGYLQNGGRMLMLLDPGTPESFSQLISAWGLSFKDGTIVDPASYVVPNKTTPLVPRTRDHFGLTETYFPQAAAIVPRTDAAKNLTIEPLIWSSPDSSLVEPPTKGSGTATTNGLHLKGPFAMGALVSLSSKGGTTSSADPGTRLAVITDSDFAANGHFQDGNNGDLFIAVTTWLSQGKSVVSINRKLLPTRRLILSPEEARFLQLSSVGLFPLILIILGGYLWWRRSR